LRRHVVFVVLIFLLILFHHGAKQAFANQQIRRLHLQEIFKATCASEGSHRLASESLGHQAREHHAQPTAINGVEVEIDAGGGVEREAYCTEARPSAAQRPAYDS
jgi:hypothetical protein